MRTTALAFAIACLVTIIACGGRSDSSRSLTAPSATPPSPTPAPPGSQRSTTDRPDDIAGRQVHVMYVLPQDGIDQRFDADGTISGAVQWARNWFADQTGGRRVRYDTFQGALDITFLRTSRTDAEYVSMGVGIRGGLAMDLVSAGFTDTTKIYSVFFGGGSPRFGSVPCGQGARPGNMSALYLACFLERSDIQASLIVHGLSKVFGMAAMHEILHNLGAVPDCGPHQVNAGHASDDPRDIMVSSGSEQLAAFLDSGFVPLLDAGRDDYYGHANPGCLDVSASDLFE